MNLQPINPLLWDEAVTDRNQGDVDRAKELRAIAWPDMTVDEQAEYLAGLKGCLNKSDLERIESNIKLISDVLELNLTTYVNAIPEFPTTTYYSNLIGNVSTIRSAYSIHVDTPNTPSVPLTYFQKWNDIEKILDDVHDTLLSNFHYYCGNEIYSGDDTGLLL